MITWRWYKYCFILEENCENLLWYTLFLIYKPMSIRGHKNYLLYTEINNIYIIVRKSYNHLHRFCWLSNFQSQSINCQVVKLPHIRIYNFFGVHEVKLQKRRTDWRSKLISSEVSSVSFFCLFFITISSKIAIYSLYIVLTVVIS